MRKQVSVWLVASVLGLGCRCGALPEENQTTDGGALEPSTVVTSLIGVAVDEAGGPVAGVALTAHGKTATTAADGTFLIQQVTVPAARCVVVGRKAGYFTSAKAASPVADGATPLRLVFAAATPQAVSAAGGTVSSGAASVQFAASSFATASGASLSGDAQVAARHLNPTSATFNAAFPGDFQGTRADGSEALLYSFGALQVELSGAAGEAVQLAAGKQATVTVPVPASMQGAAPPSIPLWYFDEEAGLWKEEGAATLEGGVYVGQVSHFTFWNCDKPEKSAYLTGRVTCGGQPTEGVVVEATQGQATTRADGTFKMGVPANVALQVSVQAASNEGLFSAAPVAVAPLAAQETRDLGTLALDACPATLKGQLVGCTDQPTSGWVVATWGSARRVVWAPGGQFQVSVPANTVVTLVPKVDDAAGSATQVTSGASASTTDAGSLKVCSAAASCNFVDVPSLARNLALSPDGAAVAGLFMKTGWELRDAKTGALLHSHVLATDTDSDAAQFSADGKRVLVTAGYGFIPRVFDAASGALLSAVNTLEGAQLTPDGTQVVAADLSNHQLGIWAADSGALVKALGFNGGGLTHVLGFRQSGTQALVLTHFASANATVTVWDVVGDTQVAQYVVGKSFGFGGSFWARSADGSLLALPMTDTQVLPYAAFFRTLDGQRLTPTHFDFNLSSGLAIRPDNAAFASQVADPAASGKVLAPALYGLPDLQPMRALPMLSNKTVRDFSFSADGRWLAGGVDKQFIRVWDLASCK